MPSIIADLLVNLIGDDTTLLAASRRSTLALEETATAALKTNTSMAAAGKAASSGANNAANSWSTAATKIANAGKFAGLALAAIAGYSVDAAAKFQAAMELIHTQAGASQNEVDTLAQSVLNLAPTVGIGPERLAEGLFHVESAGFRGKEALDILTASARNAATGMSDMETTTQAMIGVMAAGLPDVRDAADAAAYLNTTVGIGDVRMQALSTAIATGVLPTFRNAGLGMTDFSAALATLTDNVTPANAAATRLRMTIALLGAPSQAAYAALEAVGLSANDAKKALSDRKYLEQYGVHVSKLADDLTKPDGLLVAVEDLKSHLSGLDTATRAAVIERAFGGGRTSAAIQTLLTESDRLKSKYEALGTSATRAAQQQESWAKTQQTFHQQAQQLGAALQKMAIELGEKLLPPLTKFVEFLTAHQGRMQAFFVVLLIFLGLMTVAWIAMGIAAIAATWEILLIIALIAGVAFAIYELVKNWGAAWAEIKRLALDVWHALVGTWNATWRAIAGVVGSIYHDIADPIGNAFKSVGHAFAVAWQAVASVPGWIKANIIDPIVGFFEMLGRFFVGFWHGLVSVVVWIKDNIFSPIAKFVMDYLLLPTEVLLQVLVFIFKFAFGFVKQAVSDFYNGVLKPIGHQIQVVMEFAKIVWLNSWHAMEARLRQFVQFLQKIWNDIWALFVSPTVENFNWLVKQVGKAWDWLQGKTSSFGKWLGKEWDTFYRAFIAPVVSGFKWLGSEVAKIWDGFVSKLDWVWKKASGFSATLRKLFIDVLKTAVVGLKDTWVTTWDTISSAFSKFWGFVKGVFDKIVNALHDIQKGLKGLNPGKLGGQVAKMLGFAEGGLVPGARGQAQLAIVHGGEYVLTADQVDAIQSMAGTTSFSSTSFTTNVSGSGTPGPMAIQVNIDGKRLFDILVQGSQRNKKRNASTFLQ